MDDQVVPCTPCREGRHRICAQPKTMLTLLAFQKFTRRNPKTSTETFMCCDGKEFWAEPVY